MQNSNLKKKLDKTNFEFLLLVCSFSFLKQRRSNKCKFPCERETIRKQRASSHFYGVNEVWLFYKENFLAPQCAQWEGSAQESDTLSTWLFCTVAENRDILKNKSLGNNRLIIWEI